MAAATWEWPDNPRFGDREYQLQIVSAALFANTLVSLPTGLGKTFIAAVVMHNYFRWFPTGQIVFLAPTRPLVLQQIEACFSVVRMPAAATAHMQGRVPPAERAAAWKTRRVFYATPQTFTNDLRARRADGRRIVLVVIDEGKCSSGTGCYATPPPQFHHHHLHHPAQRTGQPRRTRTCRRCKSCGGTRRGSACWR